jgi:hypothetical protein
MNASDYLKRSALYRKLIHGPYREFARLRRQDVERRPGSAMHLAVAEPVSRPDGLARRRWT